MNRFVIGGPVLNITYLSRFLQPDYESLMIVGANEEGEKEATHLIERYDLNIVKVEEMVRPISPWKDYLAYKKIKDIIKSYKPDIVHTHAAKSGMVGRLAAAHCKVPIIVHTFHGHVFHRYFGKLQTNFIIQTERWLAKQSTGIIAISEKQKNELAHIYKICPEEKLRVLPLGLEIDKFRENTEAMRAEFRQKYLLDNDEIAIGIVGRIVPIKNHSLFIKIAADAMKRTSRRLRFFIIGDGDDMIKAALVAEIKSLGMDYTYFPEKPVKATVTMTSWIIDIETAYAGLDIVALTSLNEGTPVSLMEAQAAAKPVISTEVGGVADVVINNETGYCIQHGDVEGYAQKLVHLAENDTLRAEMGAKGVVYAQDNFSMQQLVRKTKEYFDECMRRRQ